MKEINAYLFFDGNCREAMTFYQETLGGELQVMPFSAAPGGVVKDTGDPQDKDRVMHACLAKGPAKVMASDTMPGMPLLRQGDNFSLSVNCESRQEIERLFTALSEKGKVTMPLADTFWGAYFGMLTDRFGVDWMLSFEHPKPA